MPPVALRAAAKCCRRGKLISKRFLEIRRGRAVTTRCALGRAHEEGKKNQELCCAGRARKYHRGRLAGCRSARDAHIGFICTFRFIPRLNFIGERSSSSLLLRLAPDARPAKLPIFIAPARHSANPFSPRAKSLSRAGVFIKFKYLERYISIIFISRFAAEEGTFIYYTEKERTCV